MLLVSGWFPVEKTDIPEAWQHLLTIFVPHHVYLFGAFGLKRLGRGWSAQVAASVRRFNLTMVGMTMAHLEFFGDAFQYCHRVLLQVIAPPPRWIVHPMMFYYEGGGLDLAQYAQFLGLPYTAVLSETKDGRRLTKPTMVNDVEPYADYYLFLDPDKGINISGQGSTRHVSAQQLADIARARNGKSVLVFDQAFVPENDIPRNRVAGKLQTLWDGHKLHSGAVIVRTNRLTCYLWVSSEHDAADDVRNKILQQLPIPDRFVAPCPH